MDLSQHTDDELMAAAGLGSSPLSHLSDEELLGAAGLKPVGADRGASRSFVQGFNSAVPFGNRISAGIGSGIAYAVDSDARDIGISELYKQARADQAASAEAHPTANIAGNLAGIIPSVMVGMGGGSASTPVLGNIANATKTGSSAIGNYLAGASSLGGKVARGVSVATPVGALYGYSNSANDLNSSGAVNDAKSGAIVGGALGAAVPLAGATYHGVKNEIASLAPASPKTSAELRKAASPLYDKFTESGARYSTKLTNEIADLADASKSTGIAGETKSSDQALNDALDFYSRLRGKTLSPSDVQKLDQSFADDISRFNRSGEYNYGRILNDLKYDLRSRAFNPDKAANYVYQGTPESVEALKQANSLWSQSYKAKDIEKILQKSQGTENPQTSIRTGIKNLLANDKKMANYSDEDKTILQEAMKRGYAGGLIKLLGGRLTDSVAGGIAGLSTGGPAGAIAGTIAGKAAGGLAAEVAGGIQANRLRGALQNMQVKSPTQIYVNPSLNPYQGGDVNLPQVNLPSVMTPQQMMQLTPAQAMKLGIKP